MSEISPPTLKDQHILLDTCFIIKAHEYSDSKYFDELFSLLEENNCIPVTNKFIKFEFLRGCQVKEHVEDKLKFLKSLSSPGLELPIHVNMLDDAIKIANIYSNKRISSKIGPIDCYISSYLKHHGDNLILVTINNSDFPLIVHDRVGIHTIDTKKEIITLGFYKFNTEEYNRINIELDLDNIYK